MFIVNRDKDLLEFLSVRSRVSSIKSSNPGVLKACPSATTANGVTFVRRNGGFKPILNQVPHRRLPIQRRRVG